MACRYCERRVIDGELSEYYGGYYHTGEVGLTRADVRIDPWVDDDTGERFWTICVGNFNGKVTSVAAATIPAPPCCPWCGKRLKEE